MLIPKDNLGCKHREGICFKVACMFLRQLESLKDAKNEIQLPPSKYKKGPFHAKKKNSPSTKPCSQLLVDGLREDLVLEKLGAQAIKQGRSIWHIEADVLNVVIKSLHSLSTKSF